jgi:hypothetical protein
MHRLYELLFHLTVVSRPLAMGTPRSALFISYWRDVFDWGTLWGFGVGVYSHQGYKKSILDGLLLRSSLVL